MTDDITWWMNFVWQYISWNMLTTGVFWFVRFTFSVIRGFVLSFYPYSPECLSWQCDRLSYCFTLNSQGDHQSSSTFSATNISSNIVWLLQLHDTIQMKFNFGTKLSSINLAKGEKRLVFRLSSVNLQRATNGTHIFDAKYWYVFVVQISPNRTLGITPN